MHPWGADANVLPTQSIFDAYTFYPACDYTFSFQAVQILPNGASAPLPSEITFNPDLTFTVEKCSAASFASDASCLEPWVDTTFRVAIIATLNNPSNTRDGQITFDVTIYNDCANDSIAFQSALPASQTIYLASGLTPENFDPSVT